MTSTFFEQVNRTPLSFIVLLAYLTMAMVTDPIDPTMESLQQYGACIGAKVRDGEPWRLFTHAFLHGGMLHLLFNSYFLYILGPSLAMHEVFDYYSSSRKARPVFDKLIDTRPELLACMHGSAWRGDGGALLGALADELA